MSELMKRMNVLIGLLTLAVTSNASAIKSINLPIDLGKPYQYATYDSRPDILRQTIRALNSVWQMQNQGGLCDRSAAEMALYKNVGNDNVIKSKILNALKKTNKIKLLENLPPMTVYNVNNKGKVIYLGFNQMKIDGSQDIVVSTCRMK